MANTPIDPRGACAMSQTLINNRYEIIQTLGVGGMSAVFEAHDQHLQRRVALKVLRVGDSLQSGPSQEKSKVETFFKREARALAKLSHPSIPQVYDYSDDNHDPVYIALELIDGMTLDTLINHHTLPIPVILGILLRVSQALAHAHAAGLMHRDIKPENIMVTREGRTVLMDFGMTLGIHAEILGKTVAGGQSGIFGSLDFLSPEQIADEDVGLPSDIFSFGALTYLLTTGHSAFQHKNPADILRNILGVDHAPATSHRPNIPGGLQELIGCCLVRAPEKRMRAREIAQTLEKAITEHWKISPEAQLNRWLQTEYATGLANNSSKHMTETGE